MYVCCSSLIVFIVYKYVYSFIATCTIEVGRSAHRFPQKEGVGPGEKKYSYCEGKNRVIFQNL